MAKRQWNITILPSIGRLPDGTQKPLSEMTAEEHKQFRERLQGIFDRGMHDCQNRWKT